MPKRIYDKYLYIKFMDRKYVPSFIKYGEVYFGSNFRYKKLEKDDNDHWIGDQSEGTLRLLPSNSSISIDGYKIPRNDYKGASIRLDRGYYCCTQISLLKDLWSIDDRRRLVYDMNHIFLSNKNYKSIIIFRNFELFKRNLLSSLGDKNIPVTFGNVRYSNNDVGNSRRKLAISLWNNHNRKYSPLYWINMVKDKHFSPEREYRFNIPLSEKLCKQGGMKLRIGPQYKNVSVLNNINNFINAVVQINPCDIAHDIKYYNNYGKRDPNILLKRSPLYNCMKKLRK